jgi:hypothetical protein
LGFLIITVLPSLFEEGVYRGVICDGYRGAPVGVTAFVSGLFFAVMHRNPQQFLYTFLLGAVFVFVMHYSKSFITAMAFHFLINAMQFTLSLVLMSGSEPDPGAVINYTALFIVLGLFCAVFVPLFILVFKSFVKYNKRRGEPDRAVYDDKKETEEQFSLACVFSKSFFGVIAVYVLYVYLTYF